MFGYGDILVIAPLGPKGTVGFVRLGVGEVLWLQKNSGTMFREVLPTAGMSQDLLGSPRQLKCQYRVLSIPFMEDMWAITQALFFGNIAARANHLVKLFPVFGGSGRIPVGEVGARGWAGLRGCFSFFFCWC